MAEQIELFSEKLQVGHAARGRCIAETTSHVLEELPAGSRSVASFQSGVVSAGGGRAKALVVSQ